MALSKETVRRPVTRKEVVTVESLGGEAIVRQLLLSELLELGRRKLTSEQELLEVLTWCVIDETGAPLLTRDEWQAWGASHPADAAALYGVADRLTGLEEKKTPTTD